MRSNLLLVVFCLTVGFVKMQDRISTDEECNPAVGWIRKSQSLKNIYIEIPQRCEIGRIKYHHSDRELVVTFEKNFPYHVCVQNSTQFVLVDEMSTNVTEITLEAPLPSMNDKPSAGTETKDRTFLCVHQPDGGKHNILISPTSHFYVCEVIYVVFRMT